MRNTNENGSSSATLQKKGGPAAMNHEIDECADKIFDAVHGMFAIWAVQYTMET